MGRHDQENPHVDDSPIARKILRSRIPGDRSFEVLEAPDLNSTDLTMPVPVQGDGAAGTPGRRRHLLPAPDPQRGTVFHFGKQDVRGYLFLVASHDSVSWLRQALQAFMSQYE